MKKHEWESRRETRTEHRKWEDSLDGVAYWLGDLPVPESLESMIIRAVHRLPSAAREFVYYNCQFASSEDGVVRMRHVPQARQPWLITVGARHVDESLIIHEIAHAWLGHEWDPQRGELRITQQDEEVACDLTRQWGFEGEGTERIDRPH